MLARACTTSGNHLRCLRSGIWCDGLTAVSAYAYAAQTHAHALRMYVFEGENLKVKVSRCMAVRKLHIHAYSCQLCEGAKAGGRWLVAL